MFEFALNHNTIAFNEYNNTMLLSLCKHGLFHVSTY